MGKKTNRWVAVLVFAALMSSTGSALGGERSTGATGEPEEITPKPGQVIVLSLQESILLGLKNNLAIAIEGFNPKVRAADVTGAKAVFDPTAFAEVFISKSNVQNRSALSARPNTTTEDVTTRAGINQKLPTGGTYELLFDTNRNKTNTSFLQSLNPAYETDLSLTLVQPLLRNFGVDVNRTQIKIAQNEWEISLDRFRETTMDVITQVQDVYWELIFTLEDLKVAQQSLKLAQELADVNRARVRAGVAAPVEITQAETDIAARTAAVTVAEKAVRDEEDRLKVVLNLPKQGEWGGDILPVTPAQFSPVIADIPGAVADALSKRPDYEAAKIELGNRELTLRFARNQLLPDLALEGSVGLNGLGGSFGDGVDRLGSGNFYQASVGLVLSVPLGNRAARAEFGKAQLAVDQGRVSLRNLELDITAQVREAVRRFDADAKLVQETRAARGLAEEQLRIEQKRLEAGVSTTFEVLRFQRDLATTQSAEVRTLTNYNKSLANFDRVRGVTLEKHQIQM